MNFILNTGSSIPQGLASKGGRKMTPEYKKAVAVCNINPQDLERLGKPEKVEVRTESGSVTVYAREDPGLRDGDVFIPRGPWANAVVSDETYSTGSPSYKGMQAQIKATDKKVLDIEELLGL